MKIYYYLVVLFIVLLNGINVKSQDSSDGLPSGYQGVSYDVKTITLVGSQITVATGEVEFSEDLYIKHSAGCPNYECGTYPTCGTCDYTHGNPYGCGGVAPGCPACQTYTNSSLGADVCEGFDWFDLELGVPLRNTTVGNGLEQISFTMFRFHPGPECQGYKLSLNYISGFGQVFMDYVPYRPVFDGTFKAILSEQIDPALYFCPNFYASSHTTSDFYLSYPFNTMFITITNQHLLDFEYELVITPIPVDQTPVAPCTQVDPEIECISDGEVKTNLTLIDADTLLKFSYTFEGCQDINVGTNYLVNDIDLYFSDNANFSYESPEDYLFSSTYSVEDNIVFYMCAEPGQSRTIYFAILFFYSANYQVYLTSKANITMVPITQGPVLTGQFRLYATSYLRNSQNGNKIDCDNYDRGCLDYFPVYPRTRDMALFPVPPIYTNALFNSPRFSEIYIDQSDNPPKSNVYQFGIILSIIMNSVEYIYHSADELPLLQMKFVGRLFTADGSPVTGTVPLGNNVKQTLCSYSLFQELSNEMNDAIDVLDDMDILQVNGQRYEIDLYTYDDRYYSCKNMADGFLNFTTIVSTLDTTMCVPTPNMTEYLSDPCCSISAQYAQCCRPRSVAVPQTVLSNVITSKVEDQCSFPTCAESVLKDFSQSVIGNQYDPCSLTSGEEDTLSQNLYETFRTCKPVYLDTLRCVNDSTLCTGYYGSTAKCNLRTGYCDVPYQTLDKFYLTCIFENILPAIKHEVLDGLSISSALSTAQIVDIFVGYFKGTECVTKYNFNTNVRYMVQYNIDDSIAPYCFPAPNSFDKSVAMDPSDVCFDGIYIASWSSYYYQTEAQCAESNVRCDWMGDQGTLGTHTADELSTLCAALPTSVTSAGNNYCGDCTDQFLNCFSDLTLTTQTDCEQKFACYVPETTPNPYQTQLPTASSAEECSENYGSCTVDCGYSCGNSGCSIPNPNNELYCGYIEGVYGQAYYDYTGGLGSYCLFTALRASTCQSMGGTYHNCSTFSLDECSLCGSTDPNYGCVAFGALCQPEPTPCPNKAACEAAGVCSDNSYFDLRFGTYPPYMPKCLFPRYQVGDPTQQQPSCQPGYHQDSPYGCFEVYDGSFIDNATCTYYGGSVWTMATTQEDCESYMPRCYGTENFDSDYYLPYTKRYNDKDEDDCACAGETWEVPFSWTPGVWTPANAVPLQWLPTNGSLTALSHMESDVVFLQSVFNNFSTAEFKRNSLLYKSEILCRISNTKDALESLACSCTSDGGSACFDSIAPPVVSVIKPCYEPTQTFSLLGSTSGSTTEANINNITFSDGSITRGTCISISVGEVSMETFLSKKIVALSSGFVSYQVPPDYSVYNEKKAVIGSVLSNGIVLDFFDNGTHFFELCLEITSDLKPKNYPVIDFSLITDEDNGIVEPVECSNSGPAPSQGQAFCCNITIINKVSKYLLIQRIEDYKNEPYKPFSASSQNMLYTLATFFLVLSIYGFGNLGFFAFKKLFSTEPFKLVHLLFLFLTCFSIIRCIYFFILPSGTILSSSGSNVGEYILVVLPTFLYFTSFTIVVVIWYILTSTLGTDIFKRMYKIILVVNIILYVLFIIIVLVFNFTKQKTPPTCGGRILAEYSNSSPQKVVSILYAVLQSVLSLGIGLAFIYYGRKIYLRLSEIKVKPGTPSQRSRVLTLGIICSTGFVLHCIFIIILVSANPSNMIFSFIGLIITEIIPVSTLFFYNNQFPFMKLKNSAIKSIRSASKSSGSRDGSIHNTAADSRNSSSISMGSLKSSPSQKKEPVTLEVSGSNSSGPNSYAKDPIVYLNK